MKEERDRKGRERELKKGTFKRNFKKWRTREIDAKRIKMNIRKSETE